MHIAIPAPRAAEPGRSLDKPLRFLHLPRSLRGRLVLWNVVVLLVVLSLLTLLVNDFVSQSLYVQVDRRLHSQATDLQSATRLWEATGRPFDTGFFTHLAQGDPLTELTPTVSYIKIFDATDGRTVARSSANGQELLALNRADFVSAAVGQPRYNTQPDIAGHRVRTYTFPLYDTAYSHVIAVGQVSQSLQEVEQTNATLFSVLLLSGLLATMAVAGAVFFIIRWSLRPLSTLAETMQSMSAQGLQMRLRPRTVSSEAQVLTEAFNEMVARLEASFALQRNFVGDVSHELRTPLTAMRGQIDVLLLEPELKGDARRDVQQVSAELGRMSQLVTNLLTVARAETGMLPQPDASTAHHIELDLLLIEIARQARFLNQSVALQIGQLQQIGVPGDIDLLKQLLLNLVDNALTYSRPGDSVTLALTHSDRPPDGTAASESGWAVVSVSDTGPGIAPDDLPHIFERHYRAAPARARSKLGSGLGLSIARLIAEAHGGRILVESTPGAGTIFRVWLPTSRAALPATIA